MVGRLSYRSAVGAGALLVLVGCGRATTNDTPCRSDADCDSGQWCDVSTAASQEAIYGPCPYLPCTDGSTCSEGFVCGPYSPSYPVPMGVECFGTLCLPRCDAANAAACPADQICRDTGLCGHVQCDETGGITCPENWRCDPDAALTEPNEGRLRGTTVADPPDAGAAIARGCVRKRCNEDGGYACIPSYACRESDLANGTGCVAVPCEETGHCADDARFICTPTSSHSRTEGTDENGCVWRNCEEGLACTTSETPWVYCDAESPRASVDGCVIVSCIDGNPCPLGRLCDPDGLNPDSADCVRDRSMDGGGAGTSGAPIGGGGNGATTSTGGSGNGAATSAGGAPGDVSSPGRCVER